MNCPLSSVWGNLTKENNVWYALADVNQIPPSVNPQSRDCLLFVLSGINASNGIFSRESLSPMAIKQALENNPNALIQQTAWYSKDQMDRLKHLGLRQM